jgi:hypothetical protein
MKLFAPAFAAIAFLTAETASAQVILCRMDQRPAPYYVAEEVSLEVRDLGDVIVKDAVIASSQRDRVIGQVSRDDASRISVTWEVRDAPVNPAENRENGAHLLVRLSIQKSDGKARMTILDARARKREYRTTGACTFAD